MSTEGSGRPVPIDGLQPSLEEDESILQQPAAGDSNDSSSCLSSTSPSADVCTRTGAGTRHKGACQEMEAGHDLQRRKSGRNWQGAWKKTPGRVLGVGLIRLYQLTLSGLIGNSCRHQPTCSEYGYEAIARLGLLRGGGLTLWRIAKCNPFGTSGYDPVPEE